MLDLFSGVGGFSLAARGAGIKTVAHSETESFACSVLAERFPDVPNLGDVTKIDEEVLNGLGRIDVVCGGFPCFPKGTSVLTTRGFIDISEVVVGDEVLTHESRWRSVTQVMKRIAPTISLKGHGHPEMVTTSEHPFLSVSYERKWNNDRRSYDRLFSEPAWSDASEMKGRYWASPRVFPRTRIPHITRDGRERKPPEVTGDLMWILGAWLGDGWTDLNQRSGRPEGQMNGKFIICAARHEASHLADMLERAGLKASVSQERTTTRFIVSSRSLARWTRLHFGRYSHGKRVPTWVLGLDESMKRSLLDGYIWADGSMYRGDGFKITSVNKTLLIGAKLIAQSLGFSVALYVAVNNRKLQIEGRQVNERPVWQLVAVPKARSSVEIDLHRYGLVRCVQNTGEIAEVFNIGVEGDESYIADGLVVHNCQDLSLAGKRAGLAGSRSSLFFEIIRIARITRPTWLVLENVPGLLSSNQGRDFAVVLDALDELGYGVAWRVLDAAFYGVPQRRRRVFVVGCLGDPTRAGEVLLVQESEGRDSEEGGEAREEVARGSGGDSAVCIRTGGDYADPTITVDDKAFLAANPMSDRQMAVAVPKRAKALTSHGQRLDAETETLIPLGFHSTQDPVTVKDGTPCLGTGNSEGYGSMAVACGVKSGNTKSNGIGVQREKSDTLDQASPHFVAFQQNQRDEVRLMGGDGQTAGALASKSGMKNTNYVAAFSAGQGASAGSIGYGEVSPTLKGGESGTNMTPSLHKGMSVRRLTPLECERLQGFPDGWTDVPHRDKPAADGPRYRALGNAVAVPVAEWLLGRVAVG